MNWLKTTIYRITHWEYWNTWLIYLPLAPFWIFHSIKNKSFYFFEKTNPGIPFGGMSMTNKYNIYQKIPRNHYPKTILVKPENNPEKLIKEHHFHFPFFVKLNYGLKGLGVEKVNNENELVAYHKKFQQEYLIQELITHPLEVGIFYCRYPNKSHGFITGMVQKNFLSVTGNGNDTLEKLINNHYRTKIQAKYIEHNWSNQWLQIIPNGKQLVLLKIGSHTRGAEFIDKTHLVTPELLKIVNDIAINIKGFYYGRFDILFKNESSLKTAQNFKIVELNGAMSEPTHIYDPKHSILFAWKEILRHWSFMSKIASLNTSINFNTTPMIKGLQCIYQNLKLEKTLKKQLLG